MYSQIQISFSAPGKLMQDFLNSLSEGHLKLGLSKNYQIGEKLNLEISLPSLKAPVQIQARVQARDAQRNCISAIVINRLEVEKLLHQLYELPAYNEFIEEAKPKSSSLELEEIEECFDEEGSEKPLVILKPKKIEPRECLPLSSEFLRIKTPSLTRLVLPPIKGKAPIAKIRLGLKTKTVKPEAIPQEKVPEITVEEKIPGSSALDYSSDPLQKIKNWLRIEEELIIEEEESLTEKKKPLPLEPESALIEGEWINLSEISHFLQSLIKALQRSSYYSPEHPEYLTAREVLYRGLKNTLSQIKELGIILRDLPNSAPEFLITGLAPEPVTFEKIMGTSASAIYLPRYRDYFQGKHLISLFLKPSLSQEQFYRGLEIMSQPFAEKKLKTPIGEILTGQLIKSGIRDFWPLFEEDRVYLPAGLDCRVEIAIYRFLKELKSLSLFGESPPEKISQFKTGIIQNLLQFLQTPELIKEFILNLSPLSGQFSVRGEEEARNNLIQNLPSHLLIPVGNYLLQEMFKLNEQTPATEAEEELILSRLELVWSILLKISHQVIKDQPPNASLFLERLCNNRILALSDLPLPIQKEINRRMMTNEFQQQPEFWLEMFAEEKTGANLELFLKYFSAIVPDLLQRKDWQNLYLLTEAVARLSPFKRKKLAEQGISEPTNILWKKGGEDLINSFWEQNPETQKGIQEIFLLLGELGIQILYQSLLKEQNPLRKKMLIENLLRFGPRAVEKLRDILYDPAKPINLQSLALEAIGRGRNPEDSKLVQTFLQHPKSELRIQALSALTRILGADSLKLIEPLLADPHPLVQKKIILTFGLFAGQNKYAREKLIQIAFDSGAEAELRALALQELAKSPPEEEKERQTLQQKLWELMVGDKTLPQRLKNKTSTPQPESLKLSCLDLLGKIGNAQMLDALSHLKFANKELDKKLGEAVRRLRLRLSAEK